ncbi:hypothetical protein AW168_35415 [Nocardia brasiliensis]|nr:hypothetical protein AW168_35415 [Nocardia brasiliensis]
MVQRRGAQREVGSAVPDGPLRSAWDVHGRHGGSGGAGTCTGRADQPAGHARDHGLGKTVGVERAARQRNSHARTDDPADQTTRRAEQSCGSENTGETFGTRCRRGADEAEHWWRKHSCGGDTSRAARRARRRRDRGGSEVDRLAVPVVRLDRLRGKVDTTALRRAEQRCPAREVEKRMLRGRTNAYCGQTLQEYLPRGAHRRFGDGAIGERFQSATRADHQGVHDQLRSKNHRGTDDHQLFEFDGVGTLEHLRGDTVCGIGPGSPGVGQSLVFPGYLGAGLAFDGFRYRCRCSLVLLGQRTTLFGGVRPTDRDPAHAVLVAIGKMPDRHRHNGVR